MKKLFFSLALLIVAVIGIIYGLLFTTLGNLYVASIIEEKVNEGRDDVNLKVNDFKLTMSDILFSATIDGNSNINIAGKLAILDKSVDLTYDINIKDLSKLQNIIKQKLNGSFSTKGSAKGNQELIVIKGTSKFALSDTSYNINLVDFKPSNIIFNMKNAKIEELLYLVNQPIFANGLINIDAKIKSTDIKNLDGKIITTILESKINNKVINKEFAQKLKQPITFKGNIVTNLVKTQAISKIDLNTTVINLDISKAIFDTEKGTFVSDYIINFTDLSKLYDITQTKMRGAIKFKGNIKQSANNLSIDGASSLFGGNINFNLLNDDFKASIKNIEVKSLTHMLYYPEIFISKSNIDINYNLATQVGKVEGNLINGRFIKNQYSDIINTFARFDLTKEVYEIVKINSNINKNIINTVIDMKSKYTKIYIPNSTINTEKNSINALVKATITKYSFDTVIKGSLSNPKIKVDTKAFLKSKYGKKLKAKINKLKNKLGNKFNLDSLINTNSTPSSGDKKKPSGASNKEIAEAFKSFFK